MKPIKKIIVISTLICILAISCLIVEAQACTIKTSKQQTIKFKEIQNFNGTLHFDITYKNKIVGTVDLTLFNGALSGISANGNNIYRVAAEVTNAEFPYHIAHNGVVSYQFYVFISQMVRI